MEWPTIAEVKAEIGIEAAYIKLEKMTETWEVRLQVYPSGRWAIRAGDPGYDTDHHGYWGSGEMSADTGPEDWKDLAADLIEQAREQHAQESE